MISLIKETYKRGAKKRSQSKGITKDISNGTKERIQFAPRGLNKPHCRKKQDKWIIIFL